MLAAAAVCSIWTVTARPQNPLFAGGEISLPPSFPEDPVSASDRQEEQSERFHRPSKDLPYPNPYFFSDFVKADGNPPLISKKFDSSEDVILAYYGILRDASNMLGYSGGCGTIGSAGEPYPYAYELLTAEKQRQISQKQFIESFRGTGYTTLLKLIPAYAPPGSFPNSAFYMVEIEVITGVKAETEEEYRQGSRFAYYYGIVTTEYSPDRGWKIGQIRYIPEDFLCAPWHSWFYQSEAVVQIVYGDNLKRIDQIDRTEQNGSIISIYASGNKGQYRFDFVRLTNGYDILLHEYVLTDGVWAETTLLTQPWEYLKLTAQPPGFDSHPMA